MEENKTCPKCQGTMILGKNDDLGDYNVNRGQHWKKGLKTPFFSWPTRGIEVISYACTKCGYLESYLHNLPQ